MKKIKYWHFLILIMVLLEAGSDILAQNYAIKDKKWLLIASLLGYLLTSLVWILSLKNGAELGKGAIIFSIFSAVLGLAIGIFFFNEQISPTQAAGIIIGLIGFTLILY